MLRMTTLGVHSLAYEGMEARHIATLKKELMDNALRHRYLPNGVDVSVPGGGVNSNVARGIGARLWLE